MILISNNRVLRMILICIVYPDDNDSHSHYLAMQLPCQVVDNDYHLQYQDYMQEPCQNT